MASQQLVWFITGANSGFGLSLAQRVLAHGHIVVATARSLSRFPQALRDQPNVELIEVRIAGPASAITAAIDGAVVRHGRIDVLVNNAGLDILGVLEEETIEQAHYLFDVNFFGLLNFIKAAIPYMRLQNSGVIAQIGSTGGIWVGEGGPLQFTSKFAVERLSEGLANEVKSLGIRVYIFEPGIFRARFLGAVAEGKSLGEKKEGYIDIGSVMQSVHVSQQGDPEEGAQRIYEVVTGTGIGKGMEQELRVPLGLDAMSMVQMKTEPAGRMREMALSTDFLIWS